MGALPRSRAGLVLLLLLVPPVLLALQLLVVARLWVEERDGAVAFTVISIEPKRRSTGKAWGASSGRAGTEEEEVKNGARAYEEENEMHERQVGIKIGCSEVSKLSSRVLITHMVHRKDEFIRLHFN